MRHIQFLGDWTPTSPHEPTAYALFKANGIAVQNMRDLMEGVENVPPTPNLCVWEAWTDEAGAALLEASPDHVVLLDEPAGSGDLATATIQESKPRDEKPDQTSKNALEAFLKGKGVKTSEAATLARKTDPNAKRHEITADLVAYCRTLPKAKK